MKRIKYFYRKICSNKYTKEVLYYLYKNINNLFRHLINCPSIKDENELIKRIIDEKCSLARYGDGEFRIIFGKDIGFQEYNELLSIRLKEILKSNEKNFIVGLPDVFSDLEKYTKESVFYWSEVLTFNRLKWIKLLSKEKIYYNSFISRPYIIYKDKKNSKQKFENLKKIWNDKEIVIVEGEESNLGEGNDLFKYCKKVERIKCSAENAFFEYNSIIERVKTVEKNKLILISLGPTATILAYDLFRLGFQAIDIGHIDLEYEWFLKGVSKKIKIIGKYTNECN